MKNLSMHSMLLAATLSMTCLSALRCQTFTVGGSGAAYPDIATAVAAVPDGAVLDVRPGLYSPFSIDQKSITVLGGPGVEISSFVATARVDNLLAGQQVTLQGLLFRSVTSNSQVFVVNNQGRVVLDNLTANSAGLNVSVQDSDDVRIRRCTFEPTMPNAAIRASDSNLRVANCTVSGPGVTSGIWLQDSTGDLTDCSLSAGSFASPATLTNAHLTLRGACTLQGNNVEAISGSGTLRIDPQVTLISGTAPPIAAGIPVTTRDLPAVVATVGAPGQTTTATLRGPSTGYGWLFAGVPGLRTPILLPTGADSDALDMLAGTPVLLAAGPLNSPVTGSYLSPTLPGLFGIEICWQALTLDNTNALQISNGETYAHR